jgi:hypothetical protein
VIRQGLVPPVTASDLRDLADDGRLPVIADSSTEPTPSIHLAVCQMISPVDDDDVSSCNSGAGIPNAVAPRLCAIVVVA